MSTTVGSQKLLQAVVERAPELINNSVRDSLGVPGLTAIRWLSPVGEDGYREYRDEEALGRLGVTLASKPLSGFWPAGGPVWDGLARAETGQVLLVEAKAHIAELASPGSRAGEKSLARIEEAFKVVRAAIAPRSSASWTSTFYQYANRLAFLYLLRENGVDAHLLHVLFLNARDVRGPGEVAEWHGALKLLRASLGLSDHRLQAFVHEVYVDADGIAQEEPTIEVRF
jgi:hypothetical protein